MKVILGFVMAFLWAAAALLRYRMVNTKPEERMRLVFAGTYEEFRRCCHDQGWIPGHHAIYVDDEMKLRGLDPKKVLVVRYGQYHRNKAVYSDYLKMLEATGAKALWI